jgi:ribose transport system substrate-binding protein
MAFVGLKWLDDLHHHKLAPLDAPWAQNTQAPIPSFVDTGAILIDPSNVGSFVQRAAAATPPRSR